MADPKSDDPVLRQSTRLTCMVVFEGQTSYDPRFIRKLFPGKDIDKIGALQKLFDFDPNNLDDQREILHHRLHVIVTEAADGPRGTGQQRVQRLSSVGAGTRLGLDEGRFNGLTENRRGNLPTDIAVDTGRVHEEIARHVFRHSLLGIGHDRPFFCWLSAALVLHPPDRLGGSSG